MGDGEEAGFSSAHTECPRCTVLAQVGQSLLMVHGRSRSMSVN